MRNVGAAFAEIYLRMTWTMNSMARVRSIGIL